MTRASLFRPRKLVLAAALAVVATAGIAAAYVPAAEAARCLKRLGRDGNYVLCPKDGGGWVVTKLPSRIPGR